jgi:hypothetical protein
MAQIAGLLLQQLLPQRAPPLCLKHGVCAHPQHWVHGFFVLHCRMVSCVGGVKEHVQHDSISPVLA